MPRDLTFAVRWSEPDNEFVATCDQYPSLSWLAEDQAGALAGLMPLVMDAEWGP